MRILIAILVLSIVSCAKSPVHNFIDEVKDNHSAVAMTIPGWLIKTGTNLALKGVEEKDEKTILRLGKKIKKIRFVADNKSTIPVNRLQEVISEMIEDNYQPYTTVTRKDEKVYVMVEEDKDKVKNLAILVHGEKSVVVMNMETNLTFDELKASEFTWNKNNN